MTAATTPPDFQTLVDQFYQPLFRFAYSLSRSEATASDLTQQTFYIWARKGHQLRDGSKAKSWLFTTLHREFLSLKKKEKRHPHYEMELVESELPEISPDVIRQTDVHTVLEAIDQLEDVFKEVVLLYHVEDHSYKEIAKILEIPIGTVMSRLARGREHLYRQLADRMTEDRGTSNVVSFPGNNQKRSGS